MLNSIVTIITVTYNSLAVLPDMLKSIPAGTPIILIDNNSSDSAALQDLAAEYGAVLQMNTRNVGFGQACNQGAALAATEFLLFLNPDASLTPDALEALVKMAQSHPNASAFNPRILDRNGRQSFRRGSKIKPSERLRGPLPTFDVEVPILAGSAIFCRKAMFDKIGGFDPAIFMYHEDDDLSFRLREHGPLMYCHAAQAVHHSGHGSPRLSAIATLKAYYLARSRVYVLGKYRQNWPRLSTLADAILRVFGPDTLFLKRRRAKNIGYLKGALSALKDGGGHSEQP